MLDDLTEKIQASQNKLEQLASKIPGFAGYRAKEQRREADKILRLHVARQYEEQMTRLNRLQYDLTSQGQLRLIVVLERAVMKLQLLVDRIKTASYGYAGLFDAVKVDEAALEKLYDFDRAMLDGVDQVGALIDGLGGEREGDTSLSDAARDLVASLEDLNDAFSRRQDVILE